MRLVPYVFVFGIIMLLCLLAYELRAQESAPLDCSNGKWATDKACQGPNLKEMQAQIDALRAYIAQMEGFSNKQLAALNAALNACIGQPPRKPKVEEKE